jgi:hypothetical protein
MDSETPSPVNEVTAEASVAFEEQPSTDVPADAAGEPTSPQP